MLIEEVASELYGLPPEDFTAARNARAKDAAGSGDPGLAAALRVLRRPTVGAWLLNQLVREHRREVEQVLELGVRLRAAQGTLDAVSLRALDEQRRTLTRTVTRQAVGIGTDAGRKVSSQVVAEVEETLRSAMVDLGAGAALATGLLTDTFSSNGLEPVALERVAALGTLGPGPAGSAPARAPSAKGLADAERAERAISAARQAVVEAEGAVTVAREVRARHSQRAVADRLRHEVLRSDLAAANRRVEELQEQVVAATEAEGLARRSQISSTREERAAIEAAARARRRLDALLEGTGT
ncbi:MAG: hypothetical protein ABIQ61_05670 [Ornithinibacter sp.]